MPYASVTHRMFLIIKSFIAILLFALFEKAKARTERVDPPRQVDPLVTAIERPPTKRNRNAFKNHPGDSITLTHRNETYIYMQILSKSRRGGIQKDTQISRGDTEDTALQKPIPHTSHVRLNSLFNVYRCRINYILQQPRLTEEQTWPFGKTSPSRAQTPQTHRYQTHLLSRVFFYRSLLKK